ncbi:hypothetical protein AgCh_024726 [Apium graveolens]
MNYIHIDDVHVECKWERKVDRKGEDLILFGAKQNPNPKGLLKPNIGVAKGDDCHFCGNNWMNVKGPPNDYDLYIMIRYGYMVLMKNKSDSFEMFKEYKAEVERKTREKYKSFTIRSWRRILKPQFQEFLEGV